jgi:hypothetical protein
MVHQVLQQGERLVQTKKSVAYRSNRGRGNLADSSYHHSLLLLQKK